MGGLRAARRDGPPTPSPVWATACTHPRVSQNSVVCGKFIKMGLAIVFNNYRFGAPATKRAAVRVHGATAENPPRGPGAGRRPRDRLWRNIAVGMLPHSCRSRPARASASERTQGVSVRGGLLLYPSFFFAKAVIQAFSATMHLGEPAES
jgi:hypothetical protein